MQENETELSPEEIVAKKWEEISARGEDESIGDESQELPPENAETDESQAAEATENEPQPEPQEIIKPPSSWGKEYQAKFAELPIDIQKQIEKRENDFHKGIEQYKQYADIVKQLDPIAPAFQQLQERYGDPIKQINQLVELDNFASKDPVAFIQWFAKSKNIPLDGTGLDKIEHNPVLQTLQQRVEQLSGYVQNQRQSQEQYEQQKAQSEIEQFKSSGNAEHFDVLRQDMAAILQAGLAQSIQDAYEKALWQRPDLRQDLISKQIKSEQEKARKAAEKAKESAKVNIPKRGQAPEKESIDPAEIVRRKVAELGLN